MSDIFSKQKTWRFMFSSPIQKEHLQMFLQTVTWSITVTVQRYKTSAFVSNTWAAGTEGVNHFSRGGLLCSFKSCTCTVNCCVTKAIYTLTCCAKIIWLERTVSGKSRRKFPLVNIDRRWFGGETGDLNHVLLWVYWVWGCLSSGQIGERRGVCTVCAFKESWAIFIKPRFTNRHQRNHSVVYV